MRRLACAFVFRMQLRQVFYDMAHNSLPHFRGKQPNRKKTDTGEKHIRQKKWYYVLSIREKCLSTDHVEDLGRPRIIMHSKRNMNGYICMRNVLVPTTKVKDLSVYITSLITTKLMRQSIKVALNSLPRCKEKVASIYHQNSVATR